MRKNFFLICLSIIFFGEIAYSQNVYIPDIDLKTALLNNPEVNTNGDSEIQVTEAQAFTGTLFIWGLYISDLTGIESFTALTGLYCGSNEYTGLDVSANSELAILDCTNSDLTSLDVSTNTALTFLNCSGNDLTSLNVSTNTLLTELNCNYNEITGLDISANVALTELHCDGNEITNLDISSNTALTELFCASNELTNLDVNINTALTEIDCRTNHLTSLDISSNTLLAELNCTQNELTSIDLSNNTALTYLTLRNNQLTSLDVSANTALTGIFCGSNQLSHIDVSTNPALTFLKCSNNQLTGINLRNGNNTIMQGFSALYNSSLSCIEVDSVEYAEANWTNDVDPYASFTFSEDCSFVNVFTIGKSNPIVSVYPNPTTGRTTLELNGNESVSVVIYDLSSKIIYQQENITSSEHILDISKTEAGVYILEVKIESLVRYHQLLIKQ